MSIDHTDLTTLSPLIKRACRHEGFYALLAPWRCGAFDGGCVLVALALGEVLGTGHSVILRGYSATQDEPRPIAEQHALLQIGECYLDGDGASSRRAIVARWRRLEKLVVTSFDLVVDFAP